MKKIISGVALFMLCASGGSVSAQDAAKQQSELYTPVKPADAHPYVFTSQEELDAKKESKKNNILAQIKQHEKDARRVQQLREQLWRIENAIVQKADPQK